MKKSNLLRTVLAMSLLLSSAVYFTSCQKTNEAQTFNDVFSTTNIQALNTLMQNSNALTDLPEEFSNVEVRVPEALNVQISEMITLIEKNIVLSSAEIDLLLQNDVTTYSDVVARFAGTNIPMEELDVAFTDLTSSSLNKYLLVQKQEIDQYYVDDYYHSVIELQSYMKDYVIQSLRNFNTLVENTEVLKSATTDKSNEKKKETIQVVILKNKKDMDDAYEKKVKEEKEKKHKGSKGNNGNHYGNN